MTDKLQLVKTYDFQSDAGTVSLLDFTDGFNVAYQGWTPGQSEDDVSLVQEALTVRVEGTSINHIASNIQKLSEMKRVVSNYKNMMGEQYGVFFRVQIEGETEARQSFVHTLEQQPASSVYDASLRRSYHWNRYTIGIEREPYWEDVAVSGTITKTGISIHGGTFFYEPIYGDYHSRIAKIDIGLWQTLNINYFTNPSVETSLWSSYGSPVSITSSALYVTDGTASCKIVSDGANDGAVIQGTVGIDPGGSHTCSVTVTPVAGNWKLEMYYGGSVIAYVSSSGTATQKLSCYTGGSVLTNYVGVRVYSTSAGAGTAYFDDAEFFVSSGTAVFPYMFPWGQFWLGFRTNNYGTPSAWTSRANLHVAGATTSRGYAQTGATADFTSLAGTAIRDTFSGVALGVSRRQTYLTMTEVTSNWNQMFGKFLVLARARIAGSLGTALTDEYQFNLKLVTGYAGDYYGGSADPILPYAKHYPRVPVYTSIDPAKDTYGREWGIYELGEVNYPEFRSMAVDPGLFSVMLYADKAISTSGTPELWLDSIFFVPSGEGYIFGGRRRGAYQNTQNTNGQQYHGFMSPDGNSYGFVAGTVDYFAKHTLSGVEQPVFYRGLPNSNGTALGVLVADNLANIGMRDTVNYKYWVEDITLKYVNRWETLRGNE